MILVYFWSFDNLQGMEKWKAIFLSMLFIFFTCVFISMVEESEILMCIFSFICCGILLIKIQVKEDCKCPSEMCKNVIQKSHKTYFVGFLATLAHAQALFPTQYLGTKWYRELNLNLLHTKNAWQFRSIHSFLIFLFKHLFF